MNPLLDGFFTNLEPDNDPEPETPKTKRTKTITVLMPTP